MMLPFAFSLYTVGFVKDVNTHEEYIKKSEELPQFVSSLFTADFVKEERIVRENEGWLPSTFSLYIVDIVKEFLFHRKSERVDDGTNFKEKLWT
mmetsp:Transcript_4863/g.6867  ORF Transcript_4863/g.6867 Transcript_4863/m.6867 type:complete len:94 (+) Transcript_4863:1232-1513(+)